MLQHNIMKPPRWINLTINWLHDYIRYKLSIKLALVTFMMYIEETNVIIVDKLIIILINVGKIGQ